MKTVQKQFDLHTRLFNNALDAISDDETNSQASEKINHLKWLAGHLVSSRFSFKDMAQLDLENPFQGKFGRKNPIDPHAEYPSIEAIKECWNQIAAPISEALGNLPAEVLEAEGPRVPLGEGKMGDFIDFLMHHEAYHLGQMGLLRKYLGKEALSYA